jgi:hypothetical protein
LQSNDSGHYSTVLCAIFSHVPVPVFPRISKAVQAIAGKTSEQIAERASGSSLGKRHETSLQRQAKAAESAEEHGAKAGAAAGKGIKEVNRANENAKQRQLDKEK